MRGRRRGDGADALFGIVMGFAVGFIAALAFFASTLDSVSTKAARVELHRQAAQRGLGSFQVTDPTTDAVEFIWKDCGDPTYPGVEAIPGELK